MANRSKYVIAEKISQYHDYQLDIKNNHLYLFPWNDLAGTTEYGSMEPGVDYTMSSKFIINSHLCMQINPNEPLTIHMKTCEISS